jgi:hypothetical protein
MGIRTLHSQEVANPPSGRSAVGTSKHLPTETFSQLRSLGTKQGFALEAHECREVTACRQVGALRGFMDSPSVRGNGSKFSIHHNRDRRELWVIRKA